ncbi:PIG-M-domain-containing protein [Halteromyces radiatus]|uniref:PIG-M-domain-containing protein n=1 Tax=Halteromyces radiatus TaxID=101107 RepID=UPI00221F0283|nr:PIG-M-domain-containing protein [Halteromyces radiatus]KAI8099307.1 PIG-M-domain-containing protein [Halteromyces radiatus]
MPINRTTTTTTSWLTFSHLLIASILLRVILLLYGEWQDAHMTVKYTDIDYIVFTDAARFVVQGGSPYERATYRYTPLLAWLLTPNIILHPSFGKWLFALADIGVGYLIHRILVLRGMPSQRALWFDCLWLLNPMVANISTRGNAESLLGIMVLGTLYLMLTRQFYPACALFGLSVHFKIYPIIYVVPLLFLLDNDRYGQPTHSWPSLMHSYQRLRLYLLHVSLPRLAISLGVSSPLTKTTIMINIDDKKKEEQEDDRVVDKDGFGSFSYYLVEGLRQIILFCSPTRLMFGLCSGAVFFLFTWTMYQIYGDDFMENTYLYHITRKDHRHNFSIWFYQMYLGFEHPWMGLLAFVPQLAMVTVTGIVFAKDVFFACFIQTFLFVTFNKVCTSQYFMWYICLFPLILPSTDIQLKWKGIFLILSWIAGQGLWLQSAYQLEFLGQNTFFSLWLASLFFFLMNSWIVVSLVRHHEFEPVYGKSGRIRWVWGMGDPVTLDSTKNA